MDRRDSWWWSGLRPGGAANEFARSKRDKESLRHPRCTPGAAPGGAVVGPCLAMGLCAAPVRGLPRHLAVYRTSSGQVGAVELVALGLGYKDGDRQLTRPASRPKPQVRASQPWVRAWPLARHIHRPHLHSRRVVPACARGEVAVASPCRWLRAESSGPVALAAHRQLRKYNVAFLVRSRGFRRVEQYCDRREQCEPGLPRSPCGRPWLDTPLRAVR